MEHRSPRFVVEDRDGPRSRPGTTITSRFGENLVTFFGTSSPVQKQPTDWRLAAWSAFMVGDASLRAANVAMTSAPVNSKIVAAALPLSGSPVGRCAHRTRQRRLDLVRSICYHSARDERGTQPVLRAPRDCGAVARRGSFPSGRQHLYPAHRRAFAARTTDDAGRCRARFRSRRHRRPCRRRPLLTIALPPSTRAGLSGR